VLLSGILFIAIAHADHPKDCAGCCDYPSDGWCSGGTVCKCEPSHVTCDSNAVWILSTDSCN
jgi:hypothetical protein